MDLSKVESFADGRIFSGEEAKALGLVDRLGNLEDAVEWAGRMGGIKGKISTVYAREKKFSLLKCYRTRVRKFITAKLETFKSRIIILKLEARVNLKNKLKMT